MGGDKDVTLARERVLCPKWARVQHAIEVHGVEGSAPPPPKNVEPNWEMHCSGDSYSVVVTVVVGVVVVVVVGEVVGVVTSQS